MPDLWHPFYTTLEQKVLDNVRDYAVQFFLNVLKIEFIQEKNVHAPKGGPVWLIDLIDYLFSEYANSHIEIYQLGEAMSESADFDDLKIRLIALKLVAHNESN
jgi:hypothetical protein